MVFDNDLLIEFNPWWKNEFFLEFKFREIYSEINKFKELPQMIALVGLRRIGKTTLLKKIIFDGINSGVNPKNFFYFSFDEFRDVNLLDLLNNYFNLTNVDVSKEKIFLFFDEIQKLNNWENKIKTIYDLYKGKAKIFLSGSESLFIKTKVRESLAGRIFYFKIKQLSFNEFLVFKGKKFDSIDLFEKELFREFNNFILSQGFPELVGVSDKNVIKKYLLEGIIEKVIYKDIPLIFPVKEIYVLDSLLKILMNEPGQIIDFQSIASQLNVSRQTISNYFSFLEESFLIKKLYNFSSNQRKVERKLKKYYPTILSPSLVFKKDSLSKSKVLESIIVNNLDAEFFWRNQYKNEVDIVLTKPKLIPIEIKLNEFKLKSLELFIKKFNAKKGFILTQNKRLMQKNKIEVIPAFKYFLTHLEKFKPKK